MTIPSIKEAIEAFNANDLAAILQLNGVAQPPKKKDEKVALWVRLIGDPARIRQALAGLTPRALQALQALQAHGGEMRTARYKALLERGKILEAQPGGRRTLLPPEQVRDPKSFEEVLAYLLRNGLIWSHSVANTGKTTIGFEGGQYIYIPKEVAFHLPPAPPVRAAKVAVESVLPGSARTFQRDLYLTWSAAREAPLQLTSGGLLRVGDLRRLAGQLLVSETAGTGVKESDLRRVLFLRSMATALGLLQPGMHEGNYAICAVEAPAFLGEEATERVQKSFAAWRDGNWWNELWATYVQGSTRAAGSLTDPAPAGVVQARKTVLEALATLAEPRRSGRPQAKLGEGIVDRITSAAKRAASPAKPDRTDAGQGDGEPQQSDEGPESTESGGGWLAIADIADYLQDHDEEFLIKRGMPEYSWAYRYTRYGFSPYQMNQLAWTWDQYTSEEAGWKGVEAVFIRTVLMEGLYWLGLVDLGYDKPAAASGGSAPPRATAIRLTGMGRWLLLGGPQPVVPAEAGRVVVQPNFHIFAFDPISDKVLARLDAFASRLNAERAIEYELTRESVYRGQQTGLSAADIRAWLEEVTGTGLPQNVARSLDEWQSDFERITINPQAGWLQAAAPELIDALLSRPDLAEAIVRRASPTGLVVRRERLNEVENALLAAGEMPARMGGPQDARQGSIALTAEGKIGFVHKMPSLYTYGFLQPLAETGPNGWRVTPGSVRRAVRGGLDAAGIISELNALGAGGIPPDLAVKIKAWAGHFGEAVIETLTLVQFRDEATLQELLADEDVACCIRPFMPGQRLGIAVVTPDDLARLKALLEERGVTIKES